MEERIARAWLMRIQANFFIFVISAASIPKDLQALDMDDVPVFNQQVVRLYDEGKYKEAAAIAIDAAPKPVPAL
jgi:hypothetical protein